MAYKAAAFVVLAVVTEAMVRVHDIAQTQSQAETGDKSKEQALEQSQVKSHDMIPGENSTVAQGAQIAPFGKEDTARELQSHAARTQDTLVDAVENAEVAEIKRAV
eukprot:CAMPEP_0168399098 /NCGR_PEP_ID=MMETSP0228-20121227/21916_1 /TAXON_ID=133427 /ORGANISM="Protoceratium reticulatum, Strain CCCM 535 (=CCMP 1889)" /LENGTH=105 /DNA_ID=CAMNT_0008412615 /DNA_START=69 /DNA_END=382 /DNA_ORIENTATION=+